MSSSTSSQTIPAPALPLLVATTLVVLHDQVNAERPSSAQMAAMVTATLHRGHQLTISSPTSGLAAVMVTAIAETMAARLATVSPPPAGPLPAGMIAEEVARWDDPGHPGYQLAAEDPADLPAWLPRHYLPQ